MNKKNVLLFCIFLMLVLFFSTFAEVQAGKRSGAKYTYIDYTGGIGKIRYNLGKNGEITTKRVYDPEGKLIENSVYHPQRATKNDASKAPPTQLPASCHLSTTLQEGAPTQDFPHLPASEAPGTPQNVRRFSDCSTQTLDPDNDAREAQTHLPLFLPPLRLQNGATSTRALPYVPREDAQFLSIPYLLLKSDE
jgi:hypothetical protein